MFYKTLNYSALRYYMSKVSMIIIGTLMGSVFTALLICMPFWRIDFFPIVFLKIEAVMIYYSVIVSFLGFIFSNFLVAFFVNFITWIIGIVISAISPALRFFAYYDASTSNYKNFMAFLDDKIGVKSIFMNIGENYLFDIIVLVCCILLVKVLEKRWLKNGV